MGAETGIQWCHHTFNPWWGCVRVDELCRNCYAESWDARWKGGHWGPSAPRRFFPDSHWNEPIKWNTAARGAGEQRRVFCASMADVFEDRRDLDPQRERLWRLIFDTPWLDWLLLTKRPENLRRLLPDPWLKFPRSNVWLGTSVGDRKSIARLELLRDVPAEVRFVSGEPMLEDLGRVDLRGLHWWIAGGESGSGARPFRIEWMRSIVDQCRAAKVPAFCKQFGSNAQAPYYQPDDELEQHVEGVLGHDWKPIGWDHRLDGQPQPGSVVQLRFPKKGGDPAFWPGGPGAWPREFPEVRR